MLLEIKYLGKYDSKENKSDKFAINLKDGVFLPLEKWYLMFHLDEEGAVEGDGKVYILCIYEAELFVPEQGIIVQLIERDGLRGCFQRLGYYTSRFTDFTEYRQERSSTVSVRT